MSRIWGGGSVEVECDRLVMMGTKGRDAAMKRRYESLGKWSW